MLDKGKLAFIIGLPYSGKTRTAHKWRENKLAFNSHRRNIDTYPNARIIINLTQLNYTPHLPPLQIPPTTLNLINTLLQEHDILITPITTQTQIQQLLKLDPKAEYYFTQTPPGICKHRAQKNNRPDLIPIIEKHTQELMNLTGLNHWDYITDNAIYTIIEQLRQQK